ncbi:MAG: ATP-binding protein [Candidatus Omnitrophota bacterium]|jgi:PAS domain S-box-containing protein
MKLGSFKIKIFASHAGLALLGTLVMGIASYLLITNYINTSQERKFKYIAYSKIQRLEYYFSANKALMQRIVNSREFSDFHSTFRDMALKEYFAKFSGEFPLIAYVNREGMEEVKLVKGNVISDESLQDLSGDPIFQKALLEPNKVITGAAEPESELGEPAIRFMLSMYGYFGDELIGTLMAGIPVSNIGNIINDNISEARYVVLIDINGNILSDSQRASGIFAPITGRGKEAEKIISDCKALKAGFSRRTEILGIEGFAAYAPFKEMGWSVLVILPYNEFMSVANNLKKVTLLIFIVIFVASVIVSYLLTRGIARPILKFVNVANSIARGNFSKKVEIYSKDEIGELADSFNKMTEYLQKTTVSMQVLRDEQNRFNDVAINSGDWIWEIDSQGRYTYSSPMVERILGYKPGEVLGKHFYDFFPPDMREALKKAAFEAFSRKEAFQNFLNSNMHKDGHIVILETSGTPILDGNGNLLGYRGIDRDVTERRSTEEEREKLIIELKERQELLRKQKQEVEDSRMAIKNVAEDLGESKDILEHQKASLESINKELDDFTYIVSHDLKEPLRSIDAYSKFVMDDYGDKLGEEARHYLERVRGNTERMKRLIEDLLEISRLKKRGSAIEEVEIEDLVQEAKMRLEFSIKQKGAEIIIKDKLPRIFCDRIRLAEVFLNLISNALKFNDKQKPVIEIGYSEDGDFHKFYIKDNGIGIKEEYFEKIFEIFQRLGKREDAEGTGAGLTIVKKIIQMHKGEIWLESVPEESTVFYFTIPKEKSVILGGKLIGEILLEKKLVTEEDIKKALEEQKKAGRIKKGGHDDGRT